MTLSELFNEAVKQGMPTELCDELRARITRLETLAETWRHEAHIEPGSESSDSGGEVSSYHNDQLCSAASALREILDPPQNYDEAAELTGIVDDWIKGLSDGSYGISKV